MLADRFGGSPFAYWDVDAADRERLLDLLTVEAAVSRAYEGLASDDEVVFVDDD